MKLRRAFSWIFLAIFVGVAAFFLYRQMPCKTAIPFSIGAVDARFRMSREDFTAAADTAVAAWDTAAHRALFRRVATGGVVVRAVYDRRQETWDKLEEISGTLAEGQRSYDALRARYEERKAAYDRLRVRYEALQADYDRLRAAYEADMEATQNRGATTEDTARLDRERGSVNGVVTQLAEMRQELLGAVDAVNAAVKSVRSVAESENRTFDEYQNVGSSMGDEYEAGLYERDGNGERITIYAFKDAAELRQLLAHEFGHELGLPHSPDPAAIMYRLNQAGPLVLSRFDVSALQERCSWHGGWEELASRWKAWWETLRGK